MLILRHDRRRYQIRDKYTQEYIEKGTAAIDILFHFGDSIIHMMGDEYKKRISVPCWKVGISEYEIILQDLNIPHYNDNVIREYNDKISSIDPEYQKKGVRRKEEKRES